MAFLKIFTILMVLFLIQTTLAKSIDNTSNSIESSEERDRTPKQTIAIFTVTNFLVLGSKYAEKSVELSRKILKDQDLLTNEKPEVVEFKKNLTMFVQGFEANQDTEKIWDVIDIFVNTTDYYLELPKEEETPESIFIVKILNKYLVQEMEEEFKKDFKPFIEKFKNMFEEAKQDLDKPLLDWYEKFLTITDFEEKLNAFTEFIVLL